MKGHAKAPAIHTVSLRYARSGFRYECRSDVWRRAGMTPARHGAALFRFISSWFNRIPLTIRLPWSCNTAQCFLQNLGATAANT